MSNGCYDCDALIGEHFEHDAWYNEQATLAEFQITISERWIKAIESVGHETDATTTGGRSSRLMTATLAAPELKQSAAPARNEFRTCQRVLWVVWIIPNARPITHQRARQRNILTPRLGSGGRARDGFKNIRYIRYNRERVVLIVERDRSAAPAHGVKLRQTFDVCEIHSPSLASARIKFTIILTTIEGPACDSAV